ncbi:MAG: low molecular weight phosphotyrosine protein phosphatase [Thermoleophilaceae bacterium]|nr:low molecular weight phosphotyrosine protein phosphatase [Thermoleophilaceae bacterium]
MELLFVCLGNICRSPTAEAVMQNLVDQEGLTDSFRLDSAGTGGWHVGAAPDERSVEAAARRGIELRGSARQVRATDFDDFRFLLAMDRANWRDLRNLAPDEEAAEKVFLLREFDPVARGDFDVPDPYYGGPSGFDDVITMVEHACIGLLAHIQTELG